MEKAPIKKLPLDVSARVLAASVYLAVVIWVIFGFARCILPFQDPGYVPTIVRVLTPAEGEAIVFEGLGQKVEISREKVAELGYICYVLVFMFLMFVSLAFVGVGTQILQRGDLSTVFAYVKQRFT